MKYIIIAIQTGKKYYVGLDKTYSTIKPKLFDTKKDAQIEIYNLHTKNIQNIKKLYFKYWKNVISWKKFKRGYNKDVKYFINKTKED